MAQPRTLDSRAGIKVVTGWFFLFLLFEIVICAVMIPLGVLGGLFAEQVTIIQFFAFIAGPILLLSLAFFIGILFDREGWVLGACLASFTLFVIAQPLRLNLLEPLWQLVAVGGVAASAGLARLGSFIASRAKWTRYTLVHPYKSVLPVLVFCLLVGGTVSGIATGIHLSKRGRVPVGYHQPQTHEYVDAGWHRTGFGEQGWGFFSLLPVGYAWRQETWTSYYRGKEGSPDGWWSTVFEGANYLNPKPDRFGEFDFYAAAYTKIPFTDQPVSSVLSEEECCSLLTEAIRSYTAQNNDAEYSKAATDNISCCVVGGHRALKMYNPRKDGEGATIYFICKAPYIVKLYFGPTKKEDLASVRETIIESLRFSYP